MAEARDPPPDSGWHRSSDGALLRAFSASHSRFFVIASEAWRSSAARSKRAALDCFASGSQ
jgi:hypothetical protein